MNIVDKDGSKKRKFSWIEMCTSSCSGEVSASGFCGLIACMVALAIIVILVGFYFFHLPEAGVLMQIMDKMMVLFGIGASLLGLRKVSSAFGNKPRGPLKEVEDLREANVNQTASC